MTTHAISVGTDDEQCLFHAVPNRKFGNFVSVCLCMTRCVCVELLDANFALAILGIIFTLTVSQRQAQSQEALLFMRAASTSYTPVSSMSFRISDDFLLDSLSESTRLLRLRFNNQTFYVPRNYITSISDYHPPTGNPYINMAASYPGLRPISFKTKACRSVVQLETQQNCFSIVFHFVDNWTPSNTAFSNMKGDLIKRVDSRLPPDISSYHEGPSGQPGIDVFYKPSGSDSMLFTCNVFNLNPPRNGYCDSTISVGNIGVRFQFDELHINLAVAIANDLRGLVATFRKAHGND